MHVFFDTSMHAVIRPRVRVPIHSVHVITSIPFLPVCPPVILMHPCTYKHKKGHAPALENCPFGTQISIMRVAAEEAKGPTYGRYLQSKLIGDDKEFCMQIDAHMDVRIVCGGGGCVSMCMAQPKCVYF